MTENKIDTLLKEHQEKIAQLKHDLDMAENEIDTLLKEQKRYKPKTKISTSDWLYMLYIQKYGYI